VYWSLLVFHTKAEKPTGTGTGILMHKKSFLPTKLCAVCKRPFVWRKKWAKNGIRLNIVPSVVADNPKRLLNYDYPSTNFR
jgi:hypothetical protein